MLSVRSAARTLGAEIAKREMSPLSKPQIIRDALAHRAATVKRDNIFHRLDQGEHVFASSIPLSRKSAARERAVPGGRHLLQAEGLARRAGRVRGAARRGAAGREGSRHAPEDRSLSEGPG